MPEHPIIQRAIDKLLDPYACAAFGHEDNRHHRHCYHCGRTTGNHHSWCPDSASNRARMATMSFDEATRIGDMVGAFQFVGCKDNC